MTSTPSPIHRLVLPLAIIGVTTFISSAPRSAAEEEVRVAKIISEHVIAPLSLTAFGLTESELATGLANGLPHGNLPAIGSGLQNLAGNHFLSVTDRGPTFTRILPTPGRVFPVAKYAPSLIFFQAKGGVITPHSIVPIVVDDAGTPATGVSNSATDDSVPFASPTVQNQLPFNPNGLDLEDIRMLPDGNFIAVDEYSPSIVIISDTGKVLKRYTPTNKPLAGAAYPVSAILPTILSQRRSNRGFESMAVSDDGRTAYTMTQSPLGPTGSTAPTRNSRVLRVLKLNISDPLDLQVVGQFVFLLNPATTYPPNNRPQDLKLSAAAWVDDHRLLLLERSDEVGIGGAKLVLADLTNATDVSALPIAQTLDLENSNLDLASVGITPAASAIVYENGETPEITDFKLEGLAILNRNEVAITNDNDFGIGVEPPPSTRIWVIRLALPLR